MAKIHYDRLVKKYGDGNVTGGKYRKLMEEIISNNSKEISTRLIKMNKAQWSDAMSKIAGEGKKFILPDTRAVLPPESFFVNKAAESGKILTDTLKDRLNRDLRETLNTFTPKTGEPNFVVRRGKTAGQMNPKLVDEFENKIRNTFKNYTKKDPRFGVPSNVRDIAVTEINSKVNNIKAQYMEEALNNNPDLKIRKRWIHHPSRSIKNPRKGHAIVGALKPKKFDDYYHVPVYMRIGGRQGRVGFDLMQYPHEPGAPADQVVNCHCEIIYLAKWS